MVLEKGKRPVRVEEGGRESGTVRPWMLFIGVCGQTTLASITPPRLLLNCQRQANGASRGVAAL